MARRESTRTMRWNAGFARGTDEGVRPYTCARLRLRAFGFLISY
jgi:hypothetical protein